ncbi:MAG: hypothetical protein J0H42_25745 [Rhizobiales bacterium]|nr:hypothetical protein [Hyphomicrobiales bacterium]
MPATYKFCVTRKSDAKLEKFGAEYRFKAIDGGKEAARVLIAAKLQQANTTNVHVEDYNVNNCGPIRDEDVFEITMTAAQVQQFGEAIAAGNWVGAAAIAVEVGAGISEQGMAQVGKWLGIGGDSAGIIPKAPDLPKIPDIPVPKLPDPPHVPDIPKPRLPEPKNPFKRPF